MLLVRLALYLFEYQSSSPRIAGVLEETVWRDLGRAQFMKERARSVRNAIETQLWKKDDNGEGGYYMRCIASTDGTTGASTALESLAPIC